MIVDNGHIPHGGDMANEGALIEHQGNQGGAMATVDLQAQVNRIQQVMHAVMKEDVHFGKIPGTDKPSLLKAGAEKLCMVFRLAPRYTIIDKERDGDHLQITSECTLTHIPTGQIYGSALGSCSTMEAKYAYRKGVRSCPQCGVEAIIKGKQEFGGGWLCFRNKGGCGAKFSDGDPAIEDQKTGRVANEDKADQYNTVLKMSNKRALLAAVLNATAASDIFSQDLLDDTDGSPEITQAGENAQRNAKPAQRKVSQPTRKAAAQNGSPPSAASGGSSAPAASASAAPINATQLKVVNRKLENLEPEVAKTMLAKILDKNKITKLEELTFGALNATLAEIEAARA